MHRMKRPVSDQTWSILVGFAVIVGLRLLDWAFPKGYVSRKVKEWSEPSGPDEGDSHDDPLHP